MEKTMSSSIGTTNENLISLLVKLQSACIDVLLSSGGLAIGTASKKKVKVVNATKAFVDGKIVTITSQEVALSGTVSADAFNIYAIVCDNSGTLQAVMGTEASTLAGVIFPTVPTDNCVLGFVTVNPTGTGDFVGGTTDLDDATVVPTAAYYNTPYPFNPNAVTL